MCYSGDLNAPEMDTGLIDSHDDVGINVTRMQCVQYRKVTTCSPIQTKDCRIDFNNTDINSLTMNDTLVQYFYGGTIGAKYTYQYSKHSLLEEDGSELM